MTNINTEANAVEEKDRKLQEIEELKADIQEVLLTIQQVQKTTKKLQKRNRIASIVSTESEAEHGNNLIIDSSKKEKNATVSNVAIRDLQVQCISFSRDLSWDSLRNLTRRNYDNLTNNDKQFAKLVKSLFFPDLKFVSNIFDNKHNITKWKRHLADLHKIIEIQKGISFGEYLFKENLSFSQEIYDSYTEKSLFGKNLDEDHKRKITREFFNKYDSDIIENVRAKYDLTSEEARVFTIYLACMSDFDKKVLGFDYKSMHEFFQNVWIKINHNQDEFRRKQQTSNNDQKVIVHSDSSRFKSSVSLGFDSYFTLLNHKKFELWFSEQKCGSSYSICKNFKDIDDPLHKSVFNLAQKHTNNKFQAILHKLGFTVLQSIDFSNSLFKRYTYYYDAQGNNFLQKMKSTKYLHDLIFGLERNKIPNAKQLARKLIKSAKDNHRLIALMQNGHTLNDEAKVIDHLDIINRHRQPLRIMGEIFSFKPIKNEKGDYIVSIEGYSKKLLKKLERSHSTFDSKLYYELNSIFKSISISRNCKIEEMVASPKYIESLLFAYNEILHEIYQYFVDSKNFVSFEMLKDGKTFICSEIASEDISDVKLWLGKNQNMYSVVPYTINYIWKLPFYGKLKEISRSNPIKLSKTKELAFKRLFSYNDKEVLDFLKEMTSKDFSEEDFEQKVKTDSEHSLIFNILYLLKGNTRLKLRKNLFEQGDLIRSLLFLDEEGNPVRIFGDDKNLTSMENPYLNIKINFNEIFSINRFLDRNVLSTFPIAIKSGKSSTRHSELKFRFCRVDGIRAGKKGVKAREMYIERIREMLSHVDEINDAIEILYSKPAISFNLLRGENREIMMKLFIYLFFEYYEVWEEFSNSLMAYLKKNLQFKAENMVLSKKFLNSGWNIILKSVKEDLDKKWLIHYVVKNNTSKITERKIKILPAFVNVLNKNTSKEKFGYMKELTLFCNYNSLYLQVLSVLRNEIMPLILVDNMGELNSKSSNNWRNVVDWVEKACN